MTIFLTSAPLAPVPSILKAKIFAEFPSGPLGVGDAPVDEIAEIDTEAGVLRLLTSTDCIKDRLAAYYH